jgi:leucyl-tRNA synthetase
MFMGPWDQGGPWSPSGIGGVHRVPQPRLDDRARSARPRAGRRRGGAPAPGQSEAEAEAASARRRIGRLRDVTADYEAFHFNTMVAKLMELANVLFRYRGTAVAGRRGLGRGRPPAAADAGARGAPYQRGAVEPRLAETGRPGRRSTARRGRRSTRPP